MPRGTVKTKKLESKKVKKVIKKEVVKKTLKISLQKIKEELHFFKGLAMMLVILMICIFFAFGALFSSMYLEVRMTRIAFENVFSKAVFDPTYNWEFGLDSSDLVKEGKNIEELKKPEDLDWLSFSKYGVSVSFPDYWTYSDKPYQRQIYFHSDGVVRDENSRELGDLIVYATNKDNYSGDYVGEIIELTDTPAIQYKIVNEQGEFRVVVVPVPSGYIELQFRITGENQEELTEEMVAEILDRFVVVKE